jgi:hypothetical protein
MPSLELAAGQVLTAAHTNTYWMRQVIAAGLSSARPTGYEGRAVYDTDTDAFNIYASVGTGWRPPWNLPWGYLGHAVLNANQNSVGAGGVDITGLSVTVTVPANRRLRITAKAKLLTGTLAAATSLILLRDAGQIDTADLSNDSSTPAASFGIDLASFDHAPAAGAHTYKLQAFFSVNTDNSVVAAVNDPAFIVVEDIGPAGAPA